MITRLLIKKVSQGKINLLLDITLALLFVVVMEEHFTGLTLHELIGVGFGVGLLVHLILHWRWVVSITRTFFRKLFHESRFNYLFNLILFVDLFLIIVTGLGISRTLGLNLGLADEVTGTFKRLHVLASNFSLLLVGLHVGLHWKWITTHVKRYFFRLPSRHLAVLPVRSGASVQIVRNSQPSTGGQS